MVDSAFYTAQILPVLRQHCFECHSEAAGKKLRGALKLDSREGLLRGGESGAAVVVGKPGESLLVTAMRYDGLQMPPKGKLPAEVIARVEKWVAAGAPMPDAAADPARAGGSKAEDPAQRLARELDTARRSHWAFQPLSKAEPPRLADGSAPAAWRESPIDRFVAAKLAEKKLSPSAPADRAAWLRRVSFDLVGLPPSPDEVRAFLADDSPEAREKVLDRLLQSRHYGERWGRYWLDLARYADSNGFHNDGDRPLAWKYRDWVITAFNDDMPYADFVARQLAGDEVAGADDRTIVATGFCRAGPSNDDNMGRDLEKYRLDQLDDVISTTSTVFLGITIGCARCHDHKYDPLPIDDYYRFLAIFNSTEKSGVSSKKGAAAEANKQPSALGLVESSAKVRPTFVLRRGDAKNRGREVQPGVPVMLASTEITFPAPEKDAKSTGRRRALAEWITAPHNALAYRVLANRLWQQHFGRGIVTSPSNFGLNGDPPTHPELLDYLASRIIADGGRIKPLHKEILLSQTFGQSSQAGPAARQLDVDNQWLSRSGLRRLEAEILRDAVLAVSGKLNFDMGGPGIKPRIRADLLTASQRNKWPIVKTEGPEHWRRSVYIYQKRQLFMPLMELFDAPSANDSCSRRTESVVPTQALVMMNDEFIEDQAGYLADRALRESNNDTATAVANALWHAFAREPSPEKLAEARGFVAERERMYLAEKLPPATAPRKALADLCYVLFNSSEFLYID